MLKKEANTLYIFWENCIFLLLHKFALPLIEKLVFSCTSLKICLRVITDIKFRQNQNILSNMSPSKYYYFGLQNVHLNFFKTEEKNQIFCLLYILFKDVFLLEEWLRFYFQNIYVSKIKSRWMSRKLVNVLHVNFFC